MADRSGTIRILHVEDDADFAELAAAFLMKADDRFSITHASSAEEGMNALESSDVDCIVADYDMAGRNGIEFLEVVRTSHPDLPFILFTGKGSEEVASEAISAGVTDYLQKRGGADQFTVLAHRIGNVVEQYQTARRAEELHRINSVVREINDALVSAATTEEIDRRVCEILAAADPYRFVWIGEYDDDRDRVVPRASAGVENGYLDDVEISVEAGETARGPTGTAVRTETLQVMQDIPENPAYRPWRKEALARGYRSSAAVPLVHEDAHYGVLNVYADRRGAFDEAEQALLASLGETVAHGYHRIAVQRLRAEQYETLFENAPVMIAVTRLEDHHIIDDCNAAFAATLGYETDELIGTPLGDIYDETSAWEPAQKGETGRTSVLGSIQERRTLRTKSGERIDTIFRGSPRIDTSGTVIGTHAMYIDITGERQRQELAVITERMSFALEATDSLIFEIDLETGEEKRHGPFERLFGLSAEDLSTSDEFYERAVHPADRDELKTYLSTLDTDKHAPAVEFRTHPDNGPETWIRTNAYRTTDGNGNERIVGLDVDITRQKRRERRLEALNESAMKVMAATTHEEVAEIGIAAAEEVLDLRATGVHFDDGAGNLVPAAYSESARELVGDLPTLPKDSSIAGRVFEHGEPTRLGDIGDDPDRYHDETIIKSELHLPLSDYGILLAGAVEPDAFENEDVVIGELLANTITAGLEQVERKQELRARERSLREQNERLEEFTSMVSHDLRNPLAIAAGRTALAAEECDSEHLDEAIEAIDRMDTLVDDLLTLAREGDDASERVSVSIEDRTESCWRTVATDSATLDVQVEGTIKADPTRLDQLLANLFRNAVEHGGPDVTIRVGPLANGFYVEDTGPGIAESDREDVFESGYTTSAGGSGFGLAIVEQVVDAHGWSIELTEGSEGGARFEITDVEIVP